MLIENLSELIYKFYQNGKPKANQERYSKKDILQMVRTAAAANFRQQYLSSTKVTQGRRVVSSGEEPDYYFLSPLLSIKRFPLPETDERGKRRIDMTGYDLFRLPKNAHFTNVHFVGEGCVNEDAGEITQVSPGEENFYINNPDLSFFKFYVVKGRGIDTYNVPPCIKELDIETTYDVEGVDISSDIAFDIANQLLSTVLKIFDGTQETKIILKEALEKTEPIK